jgi:hypothetical protein
MIAKFTELQPYYAIEAVAKEVDAVAVCPPLACTICAIVSHVYKGNPKATYRGEAAAQLRLILYTIPCTRRHKALLAAPNLPIILIPKYPTRISAAKIVRDHLIITIGGCGKLAVITKKTTVTYCQGNTG